MRTPENDPDLGQRLEAINQDENSIERAWKLDQFYEELDELEAADKEAHEQGANPPSGT